MEYPFNLSVFRFFGIILISAVYITLFYTSILCLYNSDFSSFFSATLAAIQGDDPYKRFIADYLPVSNQLAINLNPPVLLLMFTPLAYLSYPAALLCWLILSFILGLLGAWIAFRHTFSSVFLQKNWIFLFVIYLSLFFVLMNFCTSQVGALLMALVMLGYHFYLKENDYLAGILWACAISLKLFPALLFVLVLQQKRLKLLVIMAIATMIVFLIPAFFFGIKIYAQFFNAIAHIDWYANSWNASVLGFLYRVSYPTPNANLIKLIYLGIFAALIIWYWWMLVKQSKSEKTDHRPFCLTLVMMLFLSPLGWLYYFGILFFPLLLVWSNFINVPGPVSLMGKISLVALFLINFPVNNRASMVVDQPGLPTLYFCGIILFIFLTSSKRIVFTGKNEWDFSEKASFYFISLLLILAYGFVIPATGILVRLGNPCYY